jgi:hypothetical protein
VFLGARCFRVISIARPFAPSHLPFDEIRQSRLTSAFRGRGGRLSRVVAIEELPELFPRLTWFSIIGTLAELPQIAHDSRHASCRSFSNFPCKIRISRR